MRIGMVTGEYPPMQGGVGAFSRELAHAMVGLGHHVHVFTREAIGEAVAPDVRVEAAVSGVWNRQANRQALTWADQFNLDVINIQFQTAAYDMRPAIHWLPGQSRVPAVVTFHDLREPYLFPKAGRLRKAIVKKMADDAQGVIATDRADETTLAEWGIAPVRWVPIGSNIGVSLPEGYSRNAWRERIGAAPGDLVISYFGFLNESKGALALVEALYHLLESGLPAHLLMIGGRVGSSDPTNLVYGEQVDALIEHYDLDLRVHWTGFVSDEEVSAYFRASDLTALPYLDGVSLRRGTLMAALAHGRAIVTTHPETRAPELEGVVHTVAAGDSLALARGIQRLWQDAASRARFAKAAHRAAELFTWEHIAEQTVAFYEHILA